MDNLCFIPQWIFCPNCLKLITLRVVLLVYTAFNIWSARRYDWPVCEVASDQWFSFLQTLKATETLKETCLNFSKCCTCLYPSTVECQDMCRQSLLSRGPVKIAVLTLKLFYLSQPPSKFSFHLGSQAWNAAYLISEGTSHWPLMLCCVLSSGNMCIYQLELKNIESKHYTISNNTVWGCEA